jgi:hypothetical protein
MRKAYKINIVILILVVVFVGFTLLFLTQEKDGNALTGRAITEFDNEEAEERTIELYFYDNKTSCQLNGEIYLEEEFIGESKNGIFILTEQEYDEKFNEDSTLSISGVTDNCFGKDTNLPFAEYWIIPDLEYYFEFNEQVPFETELTPRQPRYYAEMQGFVRPEEAESYFPKIEKYFKSNDTEDNLDRIAGYSMRYRDDSLLFRKSEYWQTPAETLKKGEGDCEDWAVATLSLIRTYNSSLKCYNALWETHISVFCYFDNKYLIYDQEGVKRGTYLNREERYLGEQENKIKLREMRNKYFDFYGIPIKERKLHAIFNEKELIIFEDDEDFIDWALSLR